MCAPMFTAALFTTVKIQKQHKCPRMDKQINKSDRKRQRLHDLSFIQNKTIINKNKNQPHKYREQTCGCQGSGGGGFGKMGEQSQKIQTSRYKIK